MRAVARVLIVVFAGIVGTAAQDQPQGQAAPPPKNLQVLPKDLTVAQVRQIMQGIRSALGVECSHCHVSQTDRASDAKPQKLIARKMLQMVNAINNEHLKDVGTPAAPGEPKVNCFTCHRGTLKPLTAPAGY